MDEAKVKECIQANNALLINEIRSMVSSSMSELKRSNEQSAADQLSQIKKVKRENAPTFRKKSNEDQYKANKAVMEAVDDAQSALESRDLEKTKEALKEGMSLLQERQKLILLADKSQYGWKTVLEYKHHDLASDEEDEKKIYRAEARASRNCRRFSSRGGRRGAYTSVGFSQPHQPQAGFSAPVKSSNPPSRSSGLCFACGKPGHWRVCCPNIVSPNSSASQQQSK